MLPAAVGDGQLALGGLHNALGPDVRTALKPYRAVAAAVRTVSVAMGAAADSFLGLGHVSFRGSGVWFSIFFPDSRLNRMKSRSSRADCRILVERPAIEFAADGWMVPARTPSMVCVKIFRRSLVFLISLFIVPFILEFCFFRPEAIAKLLSENAGQLKHFHNLGGKLREEAPSPFQIHGPGRAEFRAILSGAPSNEKVLAVGMGAVQQFWRGVRALAIMHFGTTED